LLYGRWPRLEGPKGINKVFHSETESDIDKLSDAQRAEEALGVKESYDSIVKLKDNIGTNINGWLIGSILGNRVFFNGNWLQRAAGALAGIYGNSAEEAVYH